MGMNSFGFTIGLLVFCGQNLEIEVKYCDEGHPETLNEGSLGTSGVFPWLGVLRVHLHEADTLKIALTGIVLVKEKFAIANADDIVRIPRNIFKEDSKAMFIPKNGEPWYSQLQDYMTHPEYEFATVNTIAILELRLEEGEPVPFLPICWPKYSFNASHYLYGIGYTDENKLLEKEIFKLQYINQKNCDEFYFRSGLTGDRIQPTHYQCAFAEHAQKDCVWENGLVLASNSTSTWTIVGLGVRGPGCAAPARFIDVMAYMPWVQSATDLGEDNNHRKSAFGIGFRKRGPKMDPIDQLQEVSIHDTFFPKSLEASSGTTIEKNEKNMITHPYHINIENQQNFVVDRIDKDAININIFDEKYENAPKACDTHKVLIYRDQTRIVANESSGVVSYRLTLYDMFLMGYTCVKVKVESRSRSKALVWWSTYLDKSEGSSISDMGETPKSLIKIIPNKPRVLPTEVSLNWVPGAHVESHYVKDTKMLHGISNINLLIKFTIQDEAVLHVSVYGPPYPPFGYTTAVPNSYTRITTTPNYKSVLLFPGFVKPVVNSSKTNSIRNNPENDKKPPTNNTESTDLTVNTDGDETSAYPIIQDKIENRRLVNIKRGEYFDTRDETTNSAINQNKFDYVLQHGSNTGWNVNKINNTHTENSQMNTDNMFILQSDDQKALRKYVPHQRRFMKKDRLHKAMLRKTERRKMETSRN